MVANKRRPSHKYESKGHPGLIYGNESTVIRASSELFSFSIPRLKGSNKLLSLFKMAWLFIQPRDYFRARSIRY